MLPVGSVGQISSPPRLLVAARLASAGDADIYEYFCWREVIGFDKAKCSELRAAKLLPTYSPIVHLAASQHHLGNTSVSSWGISSIFGGGGSHASSAKETSVYMSYNESTYNTEPMFSNIRLNEPPAILRPSEAQTDDELVEIIVTKLLLRSYYNIVRKNVQDAVPKAIMHFLVNNSKRELHGVFIKKLYRENLFEEMLQEREEIATKRKRCKEILKVLQQAARTLDEMPFECDISSKNSSTAVDATRLPRGRGFSQSMHAGGEFGPFGSQSSYMASTRNTKSRKSSHSGEQLSSFNASILANGGGPR